MKLPICWRCHKCIRTKIFGAREYIPLCPNYGYIVTVDMPQPICIKCIDSFIQWFKDGIKKNA